MAQHKSSQQSPKVAPAAAPSQRSTQQAAPPRRSFLRNSLTLAISGFLFAFAFGHLGNQYLLKDRVFTVEELQQYSSNNSEASRWYLSLLGEVFDVTKGKKHYEPGGSYAFFTGRDASRAFYTGKFEEDLTDNITDFTDEQLQSLADWVIFYHKEYIFKGYLTGTFYDEHGKPTGMAERVKAAKAAVKKKKSKGPKVLNKKPKREYRGQKIVDGKKVDIYV